MIQSRRSFNYPQNRKISFKLPKLKVGEFSLREWQKNAYQQQNSKKYTTINALTGAGKSIEIIAQSIKHKKVIISVPQSQIGYGFFGKELKKGDKKDYSPIKFKEIPGHEWEIPKNHRFSEENFIYAESNKAKKLFEIVNNLKNYRVVCTHATLVNLFKHIQKLSAADQKKILKDVHFWIDEAHHISVGEDIENQLGGVCKSIMSNGAGLHLATATMMRNDGLSIIEEKHRDKFDIYRIDICDILKTYRSFNSLDFKYCLQNNAQSGQYYKSIEECTADDKKTLIFIPSVGSNYSSGDKHDEVVKIIGAISGNTPHASEDKDGVITIHSKRHKRNIRIINLVEESGRKIKKDYISNGIDLDVDYIIALNMMKEGANWTAAERAIVCGWRGSVVEVIQITGRVLRDLDKGFKQPEVIQILSRPETANNEEIRDYLNKCLSTITASMLIDYVFQPEKCKKKNILGVCKDEQEVEKVLIQIGRAAILSESQKDFEEKVRSVFHDFNRPCPDLELLHRDEFRGEMKVLMGTLDGENLTKSKEILISGEKVGPEEHQKLIDKHHVFNHYCWMELLNKKRLTNFYRKPHDKFGDKIRYYA